VVDFGQELFCIEICIRVDLLMNMNASVRPGCVRTRLKIECQKIDLPERATIDLFDVGYGFDTPENGC
jgi:hypothetical protein